MTNNNKSKNKLINFPSNPSSSFQMKGDGKGCWTTRKLPGRPEEKYEIDVKANEKDLKELEINYKNIIGKVISALSRTHEGFNNYADKELGITIEFHKERHKDKNYIEVRDIKPLHFLNEDGFKVDVVSNKKKNDNNKI